MNQFALKIALLNAIAYTYPVLMATYVDSLIHHVIFGPRYYWMGYGVAFGSVFIIICTYIFNSNIQLIYSNINYSARWRSLLTFLSLYIPIMAVLVVNFGPEFPHLAISTNSLGYGLMVALIVYVHEYKPNLTIINDKKASEYLRIERLKSEYITWLAVTLTLLISFIVFCLILYNVFPDLSMQYTNNPQEQVLLFNSFVLDLFLAIIFSIFAFIELFTRVQYSKDQLMNV